MNRVIFRLLIVLFSLPGMIAVLHADQSEAQAKILAIEELLVSMDMEKTWDATVVAFKKAAPANFDQQKLNEVCAKYLKYSDVKFQIVELYGANLSRQEVLALHEHLKSNEGRWHDARAAVLAAKLAGADEMKALDEAVAASASQPLSDAADEFYRSQAWRSISAKVPVILQGLGEVLLNVLEAHRDEFSQAAR